MNDSQHLSSQFEAELSRLRSSVLQMGGLVENQLAAAIDAYSSGEVGVVTQKLAKTTKESETLRSLCFLL